MNLIYLFILKSIFTYLKSSYIFAGMNLRQGVGLILVISAHRTGENQRTTRKPGAHEDPQEREGTASQRA